jgi:hypothetical protein
VVGKFSRALLQLDAGEPCKRRMGGNRKAAAQTLGRGSLRAHEICSWKDSACGRRRARGVGGGTAEETARARHEESPEASTKAADERGTAVGRVG